jgi:hypothetical protein
VEEVGFGVVLEPAEVVLVFNVFMASLLGETQLETLACVR